MAVLQLRVNIKANPGCLSLKALNHIDLLCNLGRPLSSGILHARIDHGLGVADHVLQEITEGRLTAFEFLGAFDSGNTCEWVWTDGLVQVQLAVEGDVVRVLGVDVGPLTAENTSLNRKVHDAVVKRNEVFLNLNKLGVRSLNLLCPLGICCRVNLLPAFTQKASATLPASPELVALVNLWVTVLRQRSQSLGQSLDAGVNRGDAVTVDGNAARTVANTHGRSSHTGRQV